MQTRSPITTDWRSGQAFRPDPALMRAYLVTALLTGPLVVVFLPIYLARYSTLRYRLDDDGVWMSVGLLFRKESNVAYRRMQDVQLTRGLIQRWMGISTVAIQTASGSSAPEISLEGIGEGDALRDHLYSKMRGAQDDADGDGGEGVAVVAGGGASAPADEALVLLREIRDALRERAGDGEGGAS